MEGGIRELRMNGWYPLILRSVISASDSFIFVIHAKVSYRYGPTSFIFFCYRDVIIGRYVEMLCPLARNGLLEMLL